MLKKRATPLKTHPVEPIIKSVSQESYVSDSEIDPSLSAESQTEVVAKIPQRSKLKLTKSPGKGLKKKPRIPGMSSFLGSGPKSSKLKKKNMGDVPLMENKRSKRRLMFKDAEKDEMSLNISKPIEFVSKQGKLDVEWGIDSIHAQSKP